MSPVVAADGAESLPPRRAEPVLAELQLGRLADPGEAHQVPVLQHRLLLGVNLMKEMKESSRVMQPLMRPAIRAGMGWEQQ
jgi:hypothetical protein